MLALGQLSLLATLALDIVLAAPTPTTDTNCDLSKYGGNLNSLSSDVQRLLDNAVSESGDMASVANDLANGAQHLADSVPQECFSELVNQLQATLSAQVKLPAATVKAAVSAVTTTVVTEATATARNNDVVVEAWSTYNYYSTYNYGGGYANNGNYHHWWFPKHKDALETAPVKLENLAPRAAPTGSSSPLGDINWGDILSAAAKALPTISSGVTSILSAIANGVSGIVGAATSSNPDPVQIVGNALGAANTIAGAAINQGANIGGAIATALGSISGNSGGSGNSGSSGLTGSIGNALGDALGDAANAANGALQGGLNIAGMVAGVS